MATQEYPQTAANKVNRYGNRANYDAEFIHGLVNTTPVLHVSFNPEPGSLTPIILPMIGQVGQYPGDEEPHVYLHGYVSSRIMKMGADSTSEGLPLCVAATKIDGYVLALTPNSHSYNYRSAVLQGTATVITDLEERLWAMHLVTNSVVADRWENTRVPPDNVELQSTRIMKMKITTASAKVRDGGPEDDKKDLKRDGVVAKTWTGVIPFYERLGAPIASTYNKVKTVPNYIKTFVDKQNEVAQRTANEAAMLEYGKKK
ncbi:hypothetical protein K402DRAFT_274370 [Aulographum hederae CBS 113979]|uniref:Flavin-nucleotide-binding protein n=1 Tax=Aulographum hederae CBS 113979 TaxID=1176131 RepID=A0A6G1H924_9PEZI|nr:hypothetical protein K402DRAFT_274370 [Aulographum hederae CBS 113979]